MKQSKLLALGAACAVIVAAMSITTHMVCGQMGAASTPVYNPYPKGILPSDLSSEIARVLREIDFIEAEATRQWKALPPPTLTGNPPILQNTGVASVEILGKLMNFDKNISPLKNQACASCHMPYVAFSGPIPSVNLTMIAYPGSVHFRAGKRTAQRYTYAAYFPAPVRRRFRAFSLAEISGIHAQLGICSGVLTRSNHSFLQSILTKWATLTPPALRTSFH